jgi:hypothetical protein
MDGSAEHQEGPLEPHTRKHQAAGWITGNLAFWLHYFYIIPTNKEYSMIYIPFTAKPSLYTAIILDSMMPLLGLLLSF